MPPAARSCAAAAEQPLKTLAPAACACCREVAGFRAPYFKVNNALGAALQRLGYLYDSSISGREPRQPAFLMAGRNMSAQPCGAGCSDWGALNLWCVSVCLWRECCAAAPAAPARFPAGCQRQCMKQAACPPA